jgi:hypothetical protein
MKGDLRQGNDRRRSHPRLDPLKGHFADADFPCQSFQRKPDAVTLIPDLGSYSFEDLALLVRVFSFAVL